MEEDEEDEEGVDSHSLPWNWVMEALARSHLVDFRLLYELAPRLSGTAAREAAALRCLEALSLSQPLPLVSPASPFPLDPALTSLHALHLISLQTSNLQKHVSQDLISTIQTFVNHKKATFPNSTLETLKNTIFEGNHTLLKEINAHVSGLDIPSNPAHPFHPRSTSVNNPSPAETLLQQLNTCPPTPESDDHLRHVKISNGGSGQSNSGTNGFCIDNYVQGIGSPSRDLDSAAPPGKKLKLQNQCGVQPLSASSDGSKYSGDIEDKSRHPLNKADESQGGESNEITVDGQAKTSTENYHLTLMSPDNGHCKTDVVTTNAILSSSQCEFSEESFTLSDTEENLCMKCNEGGQLLSCCASTCPLLVHESCLGCVANFDEHGNFYCPICAYSRAVSDYVKAKKKLTLARRELNLFIGGRITNRQKHDHNRSLDVQHRHENQENAAAFNGLS